MATKKETPKAENEEVLTQATETDPWNEYEEVFVPRPKDGSEKTLYVSINFHNYLVPTGKKSRMPKPIAYAIRMMLAHEERNAEYEDEITRESKNMK